MKKIFFIICNPKETSQKDEYIKAYQEEAEKAGNEIRSVNIYDLEISYFSFNGNEPDTSLTDELKKAQDNILWADQIVFVYSVWWLNIPGKLKSFIDRVFQDNVMTKFGPRGPEPLLKNKTAVIMHSYYMPFLAMKLLYGDVVMKTWKVILTDWCGIKITKRFDFDMIGYTSEKKKQKLLKKVKKFASSIG